MPVLTTVGKTEGGASTTTSSADKLIASKFTASSGGTLTAGHFRAWLDSSGSTTSRILVYADSSGSPGALLATSDQITISTTTANTVRDYTFTGSAQITLESGATYWLAAAWDDPGTPSIVYSRDGTSSQRLERSDITYGTFPNPFGTATGTFSGPIDIWVELNGSTSGGTLSPLGKTSDGSSSSSSSANNTVVSSATASASGTLTAGGARLWMDAGSCDVEMVVYADSSGSPGALLATSNTITVTNTTETERSFTFSGAAQIAITSGTTYWIGVTWADPGSPESIFWSRDNTSGQAKTVASHGPNPFGSATSAAGPIDAYVSVASGGGGSGGGTTTTMGKTDAGAGSSASSADKTAVSSFTASASGTLTAGHAHSWLSASGSANTRVVVYANSSGAPGARLAQSDVVAITITADALTNYTFSGANQINIVSGTTYWVGLAWQDPGTPNLNLGRDNTASARQEVSSYAPDPFGTPSAQSGPVAVYVDVVSGGGGNTGTEGYTLIGTSTTTSYLDTSVATASGQTLGVGGIPTPAASSGVVLVTANSSSRLSISTPNRVYDGQGHSVAGITVRASDVTIQNFVIHGATRDGVNIDGGSDNITVQNCDFYGLSTTSGEDINAITLFGNGHKILYNTFGVTDYLVSGDPGGSHTDIVQTWNTSTKRSTSNLVVQGNRVVGPATSDVRYIHNFVQGEGKNSTDGGGGGSGTSSGWLIADNLLQADEADVNLLDIHDVKITRNTWAMNTDKLVGLGDGSDAVYYSDNIESGTFNTRGVSVTAGPGPDGPAKPGSTTAGEPVAYNYVVTAVDAAGNESGGGPPGGGTGGPPDTEAPTVPTNVKAVGGDGRVTVTWDPSTDNVGVNHYTVYQAGTAIATVAANATTATALVYVGLTNGTSYSFTVSATDRAGNSSAQSSSASATPAAAALTGVPMLPGRLTNGRVTVEIAWGANLSAADTTWTWSDITAHVRQDPGISTALGRNDESSTSNPANLTVVLDNSSHDYSLGTISAHYPYVRRNTPVRVRIDPGDGIGGRTVFQGNADGFTPGWDSIKGNLPVVTLSASGTLRRLSQGSAPLQSVYRRVMTTLPSVQAYWPMEEGKNATFAYPVKGGTPFTFTGGYPSWAADDSFDCSAPLPTIASAFGRADVTAYTDTGTSQVRFLLSIPDSGLPDGTVFMHIVMTGSITRWDLTYEIVNGVPCFGLYRYWHNSADLHSSDIISGFPLNGTPGRVSLDWTQVGSNINWTLSFTPANPLGATTAQYLRGTITGHTAGIVSHFDNNSHNANIDATIGHLTVENTITSFFSDNDVLIAYSGETNTASDGRLARLCAENGVPLQRYTGAVADVVALDQMGPQLVAPLLDLLHECEVSNQGQLWDGRAAGLQYTTHKRRQAGTVKLTINAAAGQLAGEFTPIDDDQRNRNKVTVTRLHGATYTHEDATGALGTAAIGIYDEAVTVNCFADDSTVDFAKWFVLLGTVAGYRYPSVTVDLAASPSLAPAVLDIIPGERINVTNLDTTLAGFPTATVSLIVEGIAHEITTHSWRATFRCSPYTPWAVGMSGVSTPATIDAGLLDFSRIG